MADQHSVEILADSIGPHCIRLTTFRVTFPRFILAEVNTHRMLSRNSASSRAIPTERVIEQVATRPFVPQFNQRATGMGVGEPLSGAEQAEARQEWLLCHARALRAAQRLLHVDKSRVNRLLEPFIWHTAIISATDWENFFAQRTHPAAQPEFRRLAIAMRDALDDSKPEPLGWGEWHLPLADDFIPLGAGFADAQVSAGRCARVSYGRDAEPESPQASLRRWERLSRSGHWSPAEHPARVPEEDEWSDRFNWNKGRWGNFLGWVQLRKHYPNEEVFDD